MHHVFRFFVALLALAASGCATTRLDPAPVTELRVAPATQPDPARPQTRPAVPRATPKPALDPRTGERQPLMELSRGVHKIERGFSVSLKAQRMCYFEKSTPVHCAPISSGARAYKTPTGTFRVHLKSAMLRSNKYPNAAGEPAEMPWSLCFHESFCTHAGHLPGYPASHGCIRTRAKDAKRFFTLGSVGSLFTITP